MTVFIQQVITGLSIGSIYALLAVGYALIFSIYNFSNFAFGVIMMVGTFGSVYAINLAGAPLPVAIIAGMIVAAGISLLVELSTYRPMRRKNSPRLYLMIAGIGVNMFIENLAIQTIGSSVKPFPSDWGRIILNIGDISIAYADILSGGLSVVMLICLWLFIYKTKIGLGIRASAYDVNTTGLMGVNVVSCCICNFRPSSRFGRRVLRHEIYGIPFYGCCFEQSVCRIGNRRSWKSSRCGNRRPSAGAFGDNGFCVCFLETARYDCLSCDDTHSCVHSEWASWQEC